MNKLSLISSVTGKVGKVLLKLQKQLPTILVFGGVVGVAASTVTACKATTKLDDILQEQKKTTNTIKKYVEKEGYSEKYTQDDERKDLAIVYTKTGLNIAKLYAPAVILGALSITAILTSHGMLKKRNVALAAAYTALNKDFGDYRKRLIERFGKELDQELKFNIKPKEIVETITDENGNETVVTKTVNAVDPTTISDYSKFFDASSRFYEKDAEYNLMFLKKCQALANEKLKRDRFLFLNDVYEMLDIDKTRTGQIVGWIYDKKNPIGDNFVDFGIYNQNNDANRAFVNGYEPVILLDFNVDGPILDLI